MVKNHAVALNPVDWKTSVFGFVKSSTFGFDIAGVVEEVGPGVTGFKVGDRVVGFTDLIVTNNPENGGFREHTLLHSKGAFPLPPNLSFEQGATVPLGVITAAVGLYSHLRLPHPSPVDKTSKDAKENLLVLGGSSSVGSYAVQLASKHYRVLSTASVHNHGLVASLGASKVFDQRASDLVEQIKAEGPVKYVYDAISLPDTVKTAIAVLHASGGGHLVTVLPFSEDIKKSLPENVKIENIGAVAIFRPHGEEFIGWFSGYLGKALESGSIVPNVPEVIGNSLEAVHGGLKALQEGKVSAKKLVVKLE